MSSNVPATNHLSRTLCDQLREFRQENTNPATASRFHWDTDWQPVGDALECWNHGILVIAGQTNHGKSSITVNLIQQMLFNNSDRMFLMDFTIDDTARRRTAIYLASLMQVRINDVLQEIEVQNQDVLRLIEEGYKHMESWADSLYIYDHEEVRNALGGKRGLSVTIEDISQIVDIRAEWLAKHHPGRRLFLAVDSLRDVTTTASVESELQRQEYITQRLVDLSTQYQMPIICTTHARKSANWRNPDVDDVYGASGLKYAAQVVTFVYNDAVHRAGIENSILTTSFQPPPYYPHLPYLVPVLVWHWKKNKTSSFLGRMFLRYLSWCNRVEPLDKAQSDLLERRFTEQSGT
jgi:GTPase SAR1 family protein